VLASSMPTAQARHCDNPACLEPQDQCNFLSVCFANMKEQMRLQLLDSMHRNLRLLDETVDQLHNTLKEELAIAPRTPDIVPLQVRSAEHPETQVQRCATCSGRHQRLVPVPLPSRNDIDPIDGISFDESEPSSPALSAQPGSLDASDTKKSPAVVYGKLLRPLHLHGSKFISKDSLKRRHEQMGLIKRIVESQLFYISSALLIVASGICMGFQVDEDLERGPADQVQFVLTILFAAELLMRLLANREHVFQKPQWGDALDVIIIIGLVIEQLFTMLMIKPLLSSFVFLRALRFLRFFRLLQLEAFHELRLMINSMWFCLKPLSWAILLLVIVTYGFATVFTEEAKVALKTRDRTGPQMVIVGHYFVSMKRTMVSLVESVLGGNDWSDYADALRSLHSVYEYMFLFYILFVNLAMLNIFTGIFVDCSLRSARHDTQMMIETVLADKRSCENQLTELFHELDVEGEGVISVTRLSHVLSDERVHALFRGIGLRYTTSADVIAALEPDVIHTGEVNVKSFVKACISLTDCDGDLLYAIYKKISTLEGRSEA